MKRFGLSLLIVALSASMAAAAEAEQAATTEPAAVRFADAGVTEVPDFRRHMVPLLGKLGCNSRACHGSFQGQGGLRLSLFGYDFKMDHEGLIDRVDIESPDDSYALHKALLEEPHRGGKRFEKGSWEHNLFRAWVAGGAKNVDVETMTAFERLDVTPSELRFTADGQAQQLKVVAVWADGSREDVTCLCRFQTNDEAIADITDAGVVTSHQSGDTNVVVFYDNGVQPVTVIRPVSSLTGDKYPQVATGTKIDALVVEKLRKLGIVPSDAADDTMFLRRVSLDITGTLPSPQEVQAFQADQNSDKRARKIDELLERPAYAAWWATRFSDWTGNSDDQLNNVTPVRAQASTDWYEWIRVRLENNTPYDKFVEGFVLANGREEGESFEEYCSNMAELYKRNPEDSFSDRSTMPHYWARQNFTQPEDRVISFAYNFLGVRMQCAQCHKHPFDQWTMQDFHDFKNFFVHTRFRNSPDYRDKSKEMLEKLGVDASLRGNQLRRELGDMIAKGEVVPYDEVWTQKVAARADSGKATRNDRNNRGGAGVREARLLGVMESTDLSDFEDPRQPLMDWLRSNPLMARAIVNRVWACYFNVGIVHPTDDMSLANPPSNAPLLDYLAQAFIDSGYDLKWLHREIANSDTYQRSWAPNDSNRNDERNFSHAIPRRMPAEIAIDAIAAATSSDHAFTAFHSNLGGRSIAVAAAGSRYNENRTNYSLSVFGRSIRESNCDCDRSEETSLLQTVFLQNDEEVYALMDRRRDGWLGQVADELGLKQTRVAGASNSTSDRQRQALERQIDQGMKQLKQAREKGDDALVRRTEQRLATVEKQLETLKGESQSAVEQIEQQVGADKLPEIVRRTWLRTVSREPSQEELDRAVAYIQSSDDHMSGIRDVLWALLNTKEFIINH